MLRGMGWKKKKNIIILSVFVVICFIFYQLYFFFSITSASIQGNKIMQVLDHSSFQKLNSVHIKTSEDKFINNNGVLRGVLLTNMPQYRPDIKDEFKCLATEQYIPFEFVNDDYCDCEDGSDEPSTTACVEGQFYCDTQRINRQNKFNSIPSGKVNDGICDCCDGSDEWLHEPGKLLLTQSSVDLRRHFSNKCPNIC